MTTEQGLAARLIENPLLHQLTTYQSPVDDKKLNVSFSTTTNFKDEGASSLSTVLYLGPMMCSRYLLSYTDALAQSKNVRIIFIDRPGIGKSTPVPVETRIQHVMACIPAVLSYLNVRYISLMSASAGTLYLLNFLVTPSLRSYLHPQRPYVAAMVPWVHPDFSGATLPSTAIRLPAALIASSGTLQRFVGTKIMPGVGWSSAIFGSVGAAIAGSDPSEDDTETKTKTAMSKQQIAAIDQKVMQRLWQEDTSGLGHEVLTCLRKNLPLSSWGAAPSYPEFIVSFAEQETKRMKDGSHIASTSAATDTSPNEEPSKLRLRVIFAASDVMIGQTGRKYIDNCFKESKALEAGVEYSSSVIPDSNHDSVIDIRSGAIASILDDIVALSTPIGS